MQKLNVEVDAYSLGVVLLYVRQSWKDDIYKIDHEVVNAFNKVAFAYTDQRLKREVMKR